MADTLPAVTLTDQWQSVSALTGIAAGTAVMIQNQGHFPVMAAISASEPGGDFHGWLIPSGRLDRPMSVPSGESEVWLRIDWQGGRQKASVQEA